MMNDQGGGLRPAPRSSGGKMWIEVTRGVRTGEILHMNKDDAVAWIRAGRAKRHATIERAVAGEYEVATDA